MAAVAPPKREHVESLKNCQGKKLSKFTIGNAYLYLYFEDGTCLVIESRSRQAGGASRLVVTKLS